MVSASASPAQEKRKMVKIGTHSGKFHCDEALGCFLLRQTEAYADADIVRTRDEAVLKDLDVVIDVGGKYDPGKFAVDVANHTIQKYWHYGWESQAGRLHGMPVL